MEGIKNSIAMISEFMKYIIVVIFTLLLPVICIIYISMMLASSYLSDLPEYRLAVNDMYQYRQVMKKYVPKLVSIISAVVAIWPLFWGVYIYPRLNKPEYEVEI